MLSVSNCAPLQTAGIIPGTSELFSNITTGVIDIVGNAQNQLSTTGQSNGANSIPSQNVPQNNLDKVIVDIFTAIQAIILSSMRTLGITGTSTT